MKKVIVIGGGPAGMMAAITSSEQGNQVVLLEKMKTLGRKLLITGKGRCNITSSLDMEDFIKNTPGNGKFLYSAYRQYTNLDIIDFLKKQGLETKEERGNRVFPVTDQSIDVLKCFTKRLKQLGVEIRYEVEVKRILVKQEKVIGVKVNHGEEIISDKVILATGGKSYPLTGSTGDGYLLAKEVGHTITEIKPSLVPLEIKEKKICQEMQGLSLKNVKIQIKDLETDKSIYEDFGEMIFTHFGVSGPIILSSSAHLIRVQNGEQKMKENKIILEIDLKPALTEEKLEARVLRDFEECKNKQFRNSLERLLPQKMIPIMIKYSNIIPEKKVNEITKEERKQLCYQMKHLCFKVKQFRPIEEAIITCGGISIKEINPKTMESKKVKGLFLAGELIDVDAYTGGFNLQVAYATGYIAGLEE